MRVDRTCHGDNWLIVTKTLSSFNFKRNFCNVILFYLITKTIKKLKSSIMGTFRCNKWWFHCKWWDGSPRVISTKMRQICCKTMFIYIQHTPYWCFKKYIHRIPIDEELILIDQRASVDRFVIDYHQRIPSLYKCMKAIYVFEQKVFENNLSLLLK